MTHKFLFGLPVATLLLALACSASDADSRGGHTKKPADFASAEESATASPTEAGDGAVIFRQYCVQCHGADGKLGLNGAKDLSASALTREQRIQIITNGKNMMTPFGEILTPEEIAMVADYTLKLK